MARSISECALPPRACLPVYRSSLRAHMSPVLAISPLIFWDLTSLVPWTYQGLLFQPQCSPQVLCSQWSPLDLTSSVSSWVRFAVCKTHEFLEPHYHRLKSFFQETSSVSRGRKGEQGGMEYMGYVLVYLLVFAVKGPLQTFSSIFFKDLMQQVCLGLCFIFPQSISVMI